MTPLKDKILVERIPGEKETSSGIILQRTEEPDRAKILAIGPDVEDLSVGEVVLLDWNAAIKTQEENIYVALEKSVVFVYEEE